jgi:outer membrane autotransporter protein
VGIVATTDVFGGEAQSSVDSRQLSLGAQAIVDFEARGLLISPQAGLEFVRQWSDAFTETWDTVEVRFEKDDASSLQSAVGVGVSTTVTWLGVAVQPYLALDWIHEYLDDARTINASIEGIPIQLQTDEPDRDWLELSGEVSFALAGGINATVAAQIELDHRYYERFSVFGGISIPLN